MLKLAGLTLDGFKSFAPAFSGADLPSLPGNGCMTNRLALGDVTILLGANGAGKSNIISFFKMLNFMTTSALQEYVVRSGEADSILYCGVKRTPRMTAVLEFRDFENGRADEYCFSLFGVPSGALVFAEESLKYTRPGFPAPQSTSLGEVHKESRLESMKSENKTAGVVLSVLRRCRVHQFHDTSPEAKIRLRGYIEDNVYLRSDAGNLAAFLYGMKSHPETEPYFRKIEQAIQLAFPQFGQFVLEPRGDNDRYILLNWLSRTDNEYLLGPHQLSDGTLRFAALAALFLQPPRQMPSFIVIDEPELGLHPGAIELLAEMIKGVAQKQTQVLVATQSPQLVSCFDLSQIRPIEYHRGRSVILELDPEAYKDWLEEYSSGELWEKNIIGGGAANG